MIEINGREIRLDDNESLLAWADADHIVRLAMDFIRRCPIDERTGLPWYVGYSCFWTDPLRPTDWPDNPAGKCGMAAETLVRYYAYSGEDWFVGVVRAMLDRLIAHHTPDHFGWPGVPYASAEPGTGVYFGARADGHFVTEPDKVAQAARGYLAFFKVTGDEKYLRHAEHCAHVLASKARQGDASKSPWAFRVNVRDNTPVEDYSSHVIAAVRLFEELAELDIEDPGPLIETRDLAWKWLVEVPMVSGCWKGYFEDIRLDPENANRDQYSPMETARYLLDHKARHPEWQEQVRSLLEWVLESLGSESFFGAVPIHEQAFCFHIMGSHTARFASIAARYALDSGDASFADIARRNFAWASYMTTDEGYVHVGIDRPDYYNQCWFTDGYFDYVPHFIDGMAALPEMAPDSTNHLLSSTSTVTEVTYGPQQVGYRTFDANATETLKLSFTPVQVTCGGLPLDQATAGTFPGWRWEADTQCLQVSHANHEVHVMG